MVFPAPVEPTKAIFCPDGFEQLVDLKRMDLSMEALVVKGKYGALFTDDEVNSCFERLCADGFYVWKK